MIKDKLLVDIKFKNLKNLYLKMKADKKALDVKLKERKNKALAKHKESKNENEILRWSVS